jgi:hypothetical protein
LNNSNLLELSMWEEIAKSIPELADNPEGTANLVNRFIGQYLPVLLRARTKDNLDYAWLAFWSYVIAPSSKRKPFELSHIGADLLITKFQIALSEAT